jgi:hypothetical protein
MRLLVGLALTVLTSTSASAINVALATNVKLAQNRCLLDLAADRGELPDDHCHNERMTRMVQKVVPTPTSRGLKSDIRFEAAISLGQEIVILESEVSKL